MLIRFLPKTVAKLRLRHSVCQRTRNLLDLCPVKDSSCIHASRWTHAHDSKPLKQS